MINRDKLEISLQSENLLFQEIHPNSLKLAKSAQTALLSGVPMPWMTRWPGSFPIHVQSAQGARFVDVDGIEYVDFCLGDTGAMTGHALQAVADAVSHQAQLGLTTMLPTGDAQWVAENLAQRFGLAKWQFAISATDANRFVLRFARMLTGKPKIVVHDWCYHGSVDETLVVLDANGDTVSRPGAIGPQVDPSLTTRVVPFNDLAALEKVLAIGDVACVLIEPALTNIGIVLPVDDYISGVRNLTRKYDVLLVVDETHTICAGPGGCTKLWNIQPDFVVIGKTIGGGIPVGAYGMSSEIALRLEERMTGHDVDVSGVGGTLSGSALAMSAMKATLSNALTDKDFSFTIPLATLWTKGVQNSCQERGLDWHVQQLGCRAEYWFRKPPLNGAEAAAAVDPMLESFVHLFCLNRGVLLAPFHNMALMSPFHSVADVDRHTDVFSQALDAIVSERKVQ